MKIFSRAEWGALSPNATIHSAPRNVRTGFAVHHGASSSPKSLAESFELLRAYQRLHMGNGWGDIGYNFAVDRFGNIFELRGIDKIGAHIGGANTPNIGVVLIGDGDRDLTDEAKAAFRWLYADCNRKVGRTLDGRWHSQFMPTACPRPGVVEWVRAGGLREAATPQTPQNPAPAPAPSPRPSPDVVLEVDGIRGNLTTRRKQSWLRVEPDAIFGVLSTTAEQRFLLGLGYDLGRWGVDGMRGAVTRRAWQSFLKNEGFYKGEIDSIEGPQTIRAEQQFLNDQLRRGINSRSSGVFKRAPRPQINRPILRQGMKNEHVGHLQRRLRAHGYNVRVDNDFGPETGNAVEAFQRAQRIKVDRIVGQQTWGRLG